VPSLADCSVNDTLVIVVPFLNQLIDGMDNGMDPAVVYTRSCKMSQITVGN